MVFPSNPFEEPMHVRTISLLICFAAHLQAGGNGMNSYGPATPGTGGKAPSLWANTSPRLGANGFALTVRDALPNSVAFPLLSLAPASLPFGSLTVLADPLQGVFLPVVTTDAQGKASAPFPIPNLPAIVGAELYSQVYVADAAGPFGLSASRGLHMVLSDFEMVLCAYSSGSELAVDLRTMTKTTFTRAGLGGGTACAFSADGSRAFFPARGATNSIEIFDTSVLPPVWLASFPTQPPNPYAWDVVLEPTGKRLYVVNDGFTGSTPMIECMDADPRSPTFGQAFPGPAIVAGTLLTYSMGFTHDGNTGFLTELGLGGVPRLRVVDTKVGSPSFHTVTATLGFPGYLVYDVAVSPDDRYAYLMLTILGTGGELAILDLQTLTLVDCDSVTPGQQNITGLPMQGTWLEADPRGGHVFAVGYANSIQRIDVDFASPGFGTFTSVTGYSAVSGLGLSSAGDKLYVNGTQGGVTALREYDSDTLTLLRSVTTPGASRIAVR